MRGLFVSYRGYLDGSPGGVQVCTREYAQVIAAAGIELRECPFETDRRLSTRLLRRVVSSPYIRPAPPRLLSDLARLAAETRPDFVFLNQASLAALAPAIRRAVPNECRLVVLSHGLESTDLLHFIRLRSELPLSGRVRPTASLALGGAIMVENRSRAHIDAVCTLSPFDAELERWIGAPRVAFIPRTVVPAPIDWTPSGTKVGYLGTLDHAPNLEGLVLTLDALRSRQGGRLRVRVVGGPAAIGRWLAGRFDTVDYLGPLDDAQVREEAATWSAFLHPIFCWARGCSTKLATALSWQIPIVTSTAGHRGYEWREGELVVADDPAGFADQVLRLLRPEAATAARAGAAAVARSSPTLEENAIRLRAILPPMRAP